MTIAIVSILIITLLVWLVNRLLPFKICPVCAGVSLTWLWMFIGIITNQLSATSYQLPTAILMGGTVIGGMSKLEQFIKPNVILIWKTIFVVLGFLTVYGLIINNWLIFAISAILAVTATFIFRTSRAQKQESDQAKKLEDKMKNCC